MTAVELRRGGLMHLIPTPRPSRAPSPTATTAAPATPIPVPAEVRAVLIGHIRRVDELAAMVEAALDEEDADHALAVAALRRGHQRRTVALATLDAALGHEHAALAELAHQLGIDTLTPIPDHPTGGETPAPTPSPRPRPGGAR